MIFVENFFAPIRDNNSKKNVFRFTFSSLLGHIVVTSNKKSTIMKTMTRKNIRKGLLVIILALACTTSYAQHRHHCHIRRHNVCRPIMRTVVTRPVATIHISNRLNKKDRLEMALAYLNGNKSLDAFAANKNNPIRMVMNGKKKLYVV